MIEVDFKDIISGRRSIRKFKDTPLPEGFLTSMAGFARLAPSGANLQPLKYLLVSSKQACEKMFPCTRWAGYIPDGSASPDEKTQPQGYIIVLADQRIKVAYADSDAGAAVQSMLLGAYAQGIASCWLGALDREAIQKAFEIPNYLVIHSVVAFGYPAMSSTVCDIDGDVKYFYDENGSFKVPKRTLGEIIIGEK